MIKFGDALDLMRGMPDDSVDLIVTDPPYKVISGGNRNPNAPKGMLKNNDTKIFKHNDVDMSVMFKEMYRVLRNPSHIYIMTNFLNLFKFQEQMVDAGFKIHNLLVWKKNNALPNRWYMKNCEYTLFGRKGKAFTINRPGSQTVHEFDNPSKTKHHPTEKPVDLMEYYIYNSSLAGQTVLDPFMGSGSTGVAAKLAGIDFIGFEIDETYFNIAQKRIEETKIDEGILNLF